MLYTLIAIFSLIFLFITIYFLKKDNSVAVEEKLSKKIKQANNQEKKEDNETKQDDSLTNNNIYYHPNFLNTAEFGLFKEFNQSINKKYTIAYNESPKDNYVIINKNKVRCYGKVPRLKKGIIANNGNFIISSWGIATNWPGIFHAFKKDGSLILKQRLKSNVYDITISDDGNFAICQSCKSDYEKYSKKLLFFDLKKQELLWSTKVIPDNPNNYELDTEKKLIILNYKDQPSYHYNFSGNFLDKEKWQLYNPGIGLTATEIFDIMEQQHKENLKILSDLELKENLKIFKNLLTTDIDETKYKYSKTYRYIGEIYLELNDKNKALKHFETALKINKRVGVKRITRQLKKNLIANGQYKLL